VAWAAWTALWYVLGTNPESLLCPAELFRVARSTNANVVVYETRFAASGSLDRRDPVHATWVMLAVDGHREELNVLEQGLAYGFDVRPVADGEYELRLHAQPDRPIGVRMQQGCPVAFVNIAGRESILKRIFVTAGGGPIPEVRSVELDGYDPEDGEEVREVIPAG